MEVKVKTEIESRCGIICSKCEYLQKGVCKGCTNIDKPFWGDKCPVKSCCENKKLECCGNCQNFVCEQLKAFAYDPKQGDNGLRLETCRNWCKKD